MQLYSLTPAEIEDFIYRHEAVEAVCVVGVPHVSDGNHIRAYVQVKEGKSVTEQELCNYVKGLCFLNYSLKTIELILILVFLENMGFQKRLRAGVKFVDVMPRTTIEKVDRQFFKRQVKDELLTELVE